MKKKKLISSMVFSLSLFLVLGSLTTASTADEKYEEKFEKTVSLAKEGKVILRNLSGDIEVRTWDKAEVKIDALKVSRASSLSKAKNNAEEVKINVKEEESLVRIETEYPERPFKSLNVSVYYNLTIPSQASADIKSVSGEIKMTTIGGAVNVESVSGDVTLENISGTIKAKSVSGDVKALKTDKGISCSSVSGDLEVREVTGNAYLSTVSGDIIVDRIKGSVEAKSVSGEIKLTDVTEGKNIEAKALSGSVEFEGIIYPEGRYSLESHSGDVSVTIPSDSAFDMEAKTFSGDIHTDFEITVFGKINRKSLRGSVNGGGAEVDLKTFSGDINLKKK